MPISYRKVVRRALGAGVVVGLLLSAYTYLVMEPTIDKAIALEEAVATRDQALVGADPVEEPAFTRSEQAGGGMVATLVFAVIASLIFGTLYASLRHRVPAASDFSRAVWLAAAAFGTVALIPALKYPANPPAVGNPETVGERSLQYAALLALSVLAAWALTKLSGRLRSTLDHGTRVVAVGAATVVAYASLLILLPGTPDAIQPVVPAELIWEFRVRSLGGLALLWTGLGVGLGWLLRDAQTIQEPAAR